MANSCTKIRVFSENMREQALRQFWDRQKQDCYCTEGSYVDVYLNMVSRKEARHQLSLDEKLRVVLYIGYIKPYKGISNLIEAYKKQYKKEDNVVLLVAGHAMNTDYLEKIIQSANDLPKGTVRLEEGYVPEDMLQVYFNAADVVFLPFENINNSGSAIMAMGFEKAIIAPKRGALIYRLKQQEELLYENITDGLQTMLKLNKWNSRKSD